MLAAAGRRHAGAEGDLFGPRSAQGLPHAPARDAAPGSTAGPTASRSTACPAVTAATATTARRCRSTPTWWSARTSTSGSSWPPTPRPAGPLADRLPTQIVQQFYAPPQAFPRPGSTALGRPRAISSRVTMSGPAGPMAASRASSASCRRELSPGRRRHGWCSRQLRRGHLVARGRSAERPVRAMPSHGLRLAFQMRDGRAVAFMPPASGANSAAHRACGSARSARRWRGSPACAPRPRPLGGVVLRNRREFRENRCRAGPASLQNTQAVLWLTAMACSRSGRPDRRPGPRNVRLAGSLAGDRLGLRPGGRGPHDWPPASACRRSGRGGRRVDCWSALRKTFFTLTVLLYSGFTVVLALWGASGPGAADAGRCRGQAARVAPGRVIPGRFAGQAAYVRPPS